jgi:membrane protease YdiL (CAAX protease family)
VLPRKDWRAENVVRGTALVMMVWMLAMAALSVVAASGRERGVEIPKVAFLALAGLAFHGTGLVMVAVLLRLERRTWREAFGFRVAPAHSVGFGVLTLLGVAPLIYGLHAVAAAVLGWLGWGPEPQDSIRLLLDSGWRDRLIIGVMAVGLAPLVEELIFRGLFFPVLRDLELPRMAWLGTSVFFGLIHGNAAAFLPLTLFGLFLAWLYHRTGNLLASIVAHALFNLIPFVLVAAGVNLDP